jgi:hypothetical protein
MVSMGGTMEVRQTSLDSARLVLAFVRTVAVLLLAPWVLAISLLVLSVRSGRGRRRVLLLVGTILSALLGLVMFWAAVAAF